MYARSDNGAIACNEKHLDQQNGTWSDGKWFKFHDFVLKTKASGHTVSKRKLKQKLTDMSFVEASNQCKDKGYAIGSDKLASCIVKKMNPQSKISEPVSSLKTSKKEKTQEEPSPKDSLERLKKLKKLLDSGLIDKSDYDKKKNDILKDL